MVDAQWLENNGYFIQHSPEMNQQGNLVIALDNQQIRVGLISPDRSRMRRNSTAGKAMDVKGLQGIGKHVVTIRKVRGIRF